MFKKLREKINSWTKKVSEDSGKSEEIREIKLPTKFDVAKQKFEPDLEKLEQTVEELPKPGEKGFLKKVKSKIKKVKISEKEFEVYGEELKILLLENNVALEVAEKMTQDLRGKIVGQDLLKKEVEGEIRDAFKEIIREILVEPFDLVEKIKQKKDKPYVILFVGINGSGKTTTIAKIAEYLKKKKISSVMSASDTFRAASIEQLKEQGIKVGIKVISQNYGSDPAAVGFDAVKYAKKHHIDAVLIDTAGRMHTARNLLREMEKISRVAKPDLKIFVGESITGNDAIEQVRSFDWSIGIDGIILTKADIDEKGGTALSVGYVTKKPILFLGVGQGMGDIKRFDKQEFIKKLGL